jgi:hypothetical protein
MISQNAAMTADSQSGIPSEDPRGEQVPRDRILAMAAAARTLREPHKRWAVKALVHDRYRFQAHAETPAMPCTIEEILETAYGDPDGDAYWNAWWFPRDNISQAEQLNILIDVDATHMAKSETEYLLLKRALTASVAGHRDKAAIEALEYLQANPDTAYMIPEGLLRIMGAGSTARRLVERVDPAGPRAKRKTGPQPITRDRVIAEMRAAIINGDDVFQMKQVVLQKKFRASRQTCREAIAFLKAEAAKS